MPVLEAMAAGTPVITSNRSSLPEAGGDAALLIDPSDENAMTEAIGQVLTDGELRSKMARRGLERARERTWTKAAEATAAVYRKALSSPSSGERKAA